jgi:hypothetical protein
MVLLLGTDIPYFDMYRCYSPNSGLTLPAAADGEIFVPNEKGRHLPGDNGLWRESGKEPVY